MKLKELGRINGWFVCVPDKQKYFAKGFAKKYPEEYEELLKEASAVALARASDVLISFSVPTEKCPTGKFFADDEGIKPREWVIEKIDSHVPSSFLDEEDDDGACVFDFSTPATIANIFVSLVKKQ